MSDARAPDADDRDAPLPAGRLPRGPSKSVLLIAVGGGCVVVLACGGLLAVAVGWGFQTFAADLPAATAAADQFLDLLQQNRAADAYAATSAGFQARQTPAQFAAFVEQHELFAGHTSRDRYGARLFQNNDGKQVFIQMALRSPTNAMTCTILLVEENGVWKVDKITVP